MGGRGHTSTGRPPVAFALVAALHVGFIYIFNEALGLRALLDPPPKSLVATVIPEDQPIVPDKIVPLIKHQEIPEPLMDVPVPEPFAEEPPTLEPVTEPVPYVPSQPPFAGTVEPDPPRVPVRPTAPLTQPNYPPSEIRNGHEGVVELAVLVLRDGRIAEVRVLKSSGYERLDRAAVEEVRREWRLEPARRGDVPIDEWGRFRVVFRITNS